METDRWELTDKRLDGIENVSQLRENLLAREADKRIYGQDELEKAERSLGPRIYYTDLIQRLWKLNPFIRIKDGSEGAVAVYIRKKEWEYTPEERLSPEEAAAMGIERPPNGQFFIDHKYVTGIMKEHLPEWGHVTVDSSNIAHREIRGWRSVLIALIKAKVISYDAATEEFGNPVLDARNQFWFEQLKEKRIAW